MFYRCTIIRFYGVNADGSVSELGNYKQEMRWSYVQRRVPQKYNPADKKRWQKPRRQARMKRML